MRSPDRRHARELHPESKLPLVVRIGFTGHRELGALSAEELERSVEQQLRGVARDALSLAGEFADVFRTRPAVQLLCGLASGADQCAARAALRVAADEEVAVDVELVPLSPFGWGEFLEDFAEDPEGARVAQEVWQASEGHRIEFFADLERSRLPEEEREARSREGYEALGRFLLGHTDLLVAYLDPGRESFAPGGTAAVVKEARDRGAPVTEIQPAQHGPGGWLVRGVGAAGGPARLEILRAALAPPSSYRRSPQRDRGHGHGHGPDQATFLIDDYLRERPEGAWLRFWWGPSTWFDSLVGLLGGRPDPRGEGPMERDSTLLPQTLEREEQRADHLARLYNGLHRLSFASIYLLGASAVFLAVLGTLVHHDTDHGPSAGWPTVLEFGALLSILALFVLARSRRLREKGTDYRLLAELLRVSSALWPLRSRLQFREPRAQGSDGEVIRSWMAWYALAVNRVAGFPSVTFDRAHLERCREQLAKSFLAGQVRFHRSRAHRYGRIERALNAFLFLLFGSALLGCLSHFFHGAALADSPWLLARWACGVLGAVYPIALFLTAAAPALAAALHGIATYAEFPRLERRFAAMVEYLELEKLELEQLPQPSRSDLLVVAQEVSGRMVDEVAEWRWLHAVHDVPLG